MKLRTGLLSALLPTLALIVVALGVSVPNAAAVTTCNPPSHIGNDSPHIGEILADGATSCGMVTKAISKGHLNKGGNLVTAGWKCKASHVLDQTGLTLGANISCVKGFANKYVFVFSWST